MLSGMAEFFQAWRRKARHRGRLPGAGDKHPRAARGALAAHTAVLVLDQVNPGAVRVGTGDLDWHGGLLATPGAVRRSGIGRQTFRAGQHSPRRLPCCIRHPIAFGKPMARRQDKKRRSGRLRRCWASRMAFRHEEQKKAVGGGQGRSPSSVQDRGLTGGGASRLYNYTRGPCRVTDRTARLRSSPRRSSGR